MAAEKDTTIMKQVIATLLSTVILGVISHVSGAFKWLYESLPPFWSHLLGTTELPNWSYYVLLSTSIYNLVKLITRLIKPDFVSYNQDNFMGLKWRWSYNSRSPVDILPFCPDCDTKLVYTEGNRYDPNKKTSLKCETCNIYFPVQGRGIEYLVDNIGRQIDMKIRNGKWQYIDQPNS